MSARLAMSVLATLVALASVGTASEPPGTSGAECYDIGGFHYAATTESKDAQIWFDRGLAMCFAYNHEEAVRCFQRAVAEDPGMSMAYWGMAYAWGPYINNMEIPPHQIAQAALATQLATLHADRATDKERSLIDALSARYVAPAPEDREPLNRAYADRMRALYQQHPDDSLVAALYAESLMNLQPWAHWSREGEPAPATAEIVRVLEDGLQRWPDHPALCHFYIHTMEASPTPEKALPAANRLRNAMPDAGHLVHMPTHIDVLVGDYRNVVESNIKAIEADREFVNREGRHNFYTYYRIHNYHFLVYGAMFDGQSQLALETARALVHEVPEDLLREQTDFLDAFIPMTLHVQVRFGRWEDILKEPEPADYLPVTRSIWHYARALAYATTGRMEQARQEQQAFMNVQATVPETSYLFQNASRDILGVAEQMLAGELAYREGKHEQAFEHLREAVHRYDNLKYDEPWGWMQPVRHALGALLLEQGRVAESEAVYRTDLKLHPNNPWSLHGLAECLAKQGKKQEAAEYRGQFEKAAARCDVTIDRSCYCRLGKTN